MGVQVKYDNQIIADVEVGNYAIINCAGKKMKSNIEIIVPEDIGGGSGAQATALFDTPNSSNELVFTTGMTWGEYIASDLNTLGFIDDSTRVCYYDDGGPSAVCKYFVGEDCWEHLGDVYVDDVIEPDELYCTENCF